VPIDLDLWRAHAHVAGQGVDRDPPSAHPPTRQDAERARRDARQRTRFRQQLTRLTAKPATRAGRRRGGRAQAGARLIGDGVHRQEGLTHGPRHSFGQVVDRHLEPIEDQSPPVLDRRRNRSAVTVEPAPPAASQVGNRVLNASVEARVDVRRGRHHEPVGLRCLQDAVRECECIRGPLQELLEIWRAAQSDPNVRDGHITVRRSCP
jgi:hypothetical protein